MRQTVTEANRKDRERQFQRKNAQKPEGNGEWREF